MRARSQHGDHRGAGLADGIRQRARTWTERLDGFQRRHHAVAVTVAVVRTFTEDRSVVVTASIAFWAVFSIIPLLLVADGAVALGLGGADRHPGFVIALAVDVGLFVAAFRILTSRDVVTRQVLPGALLSGLVFWVPQELSSLLTPGTCSMPARSTAASPR